MAEPYKLLYDNLVWRPWTSAITTNVGPANSPEGFRYPQATDGRRHTVWKVETGHGTFVTLTIDRGSSQIAETDSPFGVGLFNHNFATASAGTLILERSTNASSWTTILSLGLGADPVATDYIYESTQTWPTDRYLRVSIVFTGGGAPVVDMTIGQLYIGKVLTLTDDETPTTPMASPYRFPATIDSGGGGERHVTSRGVREQGFEIRFASKDAAFLAKAQAFASRQNGPEWPFAIHTHRHTAEPWDDTPDGTNLAGRGGAYYCQMDREGLGWLEVIDGVHDIDMSFVRYIGAGEI